MRPIYETKKDRTSENKVADGLCKIWRCEKQKLPMSYFIDYAFTRKRKVVSFVEIKCRKNPHTAYPTYMIAMNKIVHGLQLERITGCPFILAVKWSDCVGFITPSKLQCGVEIGGRKDRDDSQDMEPVALYKIDDFKMVQ